MLPYDDHFHPTVWKNVVSSQPESKRIGVPYIGVDIKPLENQVGTIIIIILRLVIFYD